MVQNRFEPRRRNRVAAVAADPVGPLLDAAEGLFDRLEDLGVGLLEFELDVDFVVAARLIRHVALAGVIFHRRLERLDSSRAENLAALDVEVEPVEHPRGAELHRDVANPDDGVGTRPEI